MRPVYGCVAQLEEQLPLKHQAESSNLSTSTIWVSSVVVARHSPKMEVISWVRFPADLLMYRLLPGGDMVATHIRCVQLTHGTLYSHVAQW